MALGVWAFSINIFLQTIVLLHQLSSVNANWYRVHGKEKKIQDLFHIHSMFVIKSKKYICMSITG